MLNAKAFANAVTVVTVVFYVACWLLSTLAPDLIFSIAQSWMHSVNLDAIKSTVTMSVSTALIGLVSMAVLTWITTYITIWLYNKLAK